MTWATDLVQALDNLGGQARLSDIYDEIEKIRPNLTKSWKDSVRERIQRHSSDANSYNPINPDLFYSVEGLGFGIWGLRSYLTDTPKAVDIDEGEDNPGRTKQTVYRILRDTTLARNIKILHKHACQICNLSIELNDGELYSEAHHIIPLGKPHNGPDTAGNILVLCPNCHALCDYGAIILSESNIKIISEHTVSKESIDYHNREIADRE